MTHASQAGRRPPVTASAGRPAATVEAALDAAAALLAGAGALLVCAGAGMGVDSGLPDFRGDAGFWRAYPPYERLGLSFVELADPVHFRDDPTLAWGFYGHRLGLYRATRPHEGFAVLRRWGARLPGGMYVFTSNVDGQFQRAGIDAVAEVHGSIHHLQCVGPCGGEIWPADGVEVDVDPETMRAGEPLPRCPSCGDLARPNILMFGDGSWVSERTDAALRTCESWLDEVTGPGDAGPLVVVEIGAGTAVPTVRRTAESLAGRLIRINPAQPEIRPGAGVSLPLAALPALTALAARLP
ncbi:MULTISPECIES: SIR2 family NAD-dependent protein deacylase [Frankia]|nr:MULTISPECIES: Sir2 family NAD-dependent protein deacetylase [Frankia]